MQRLIKYKEHIWGTYGNIKPYLCFGGCSYVTKYIFLLSLLDNKENINYYKKQDWFAREENIADKYNVNHDVLVNPQMF